MISYIKCFWYIIKHKWYVLVECFRRGLYRRGLVHDFSKLRPSEFFIYAKKFFSDEHNDFHEKRNRLGYYVPTDYGEDFIKAWMLHYTRNSHHWQKFVFPLDGEEVGVIRMGKDDVLEMLCDWIGAGKAQKSEVHVRDWYEANKDKMLLHDSSRKLLESELKKVK